MTCPFAWRKEVASKSLPVVGSTRCCPFWSAVAGGALRALPCALALSWTTSVVGVAWGRGVEGGGAALACGAARRACVAGAGVGGNPGGERAADPVAAVGWTVCAGEGAGEGASALRAPSKLHGIDGDGSSARWNSSL
jgi:hypothetical protein